MQGMPASRILSIAFSSTFRQATPTIASTCPLTMIFMHDRRAFGDQHLVAQSSAVVAKVGDAARAAALAVQPEFVVLGRAALGVLQAMGQQQQAARGRRAATWSRQNSQANDDHRPADVAFGQAHLVQELARVTVSISSLVNGRDLSSSAATSAHVGANLLPQPPRSAGTTSGATCCGGPTCAGFAAQCAVAIVGRRGAAQGAVAKVGILQRRRWWAPASVELGHVVDRRRVARPRAETVKISG